MTSIKELLDSLSKQQQNMLRYAFENDIPHFEKLPNGSFVGVHVTGIPNLVITEQAGEWAHGTIKTPTKN